MAEVVVQNKGPYDWKYVLFKKGTIDQVTGRGKIDKEFVFPGRLQAPKNITMVDPNDWELLKIQYPQIDELLSQKKDGLEVLEAIPTSYYDAAHFIAIERQRANGLQSEVSEKNAEIVGLKTEIERLKDVIVSYGGKV